MAKACWKTNTTFQLVINIRSNYLVDVEKSPALPGLFFATAAGDLFNQPFSGGFERCSAHDILHQ